MWIRRAALWVSTAMVALIVALAVPFDTLQACMDDHVNGAEGFAPDKAVTICCLDHPIGGAAANTVCTDTQAGCEACVDAQLDTIANATQITAGCADYLVQRQN